MSDAQRPDLIEFPTDYIFKAFGPGDDHFVADVRRAVATVRPVSDHAVKVRPSSAGAYVAVSVVVWVEQLAEVHAIYAALKGVDRIKFIL